VGEERVPRGEAPSCRRPPLGLLRRPQAVKAGGVLTQAEQRGQAQLLGEVLADFEHWTRHTTGAVPLGDPEASFVAACRRAARRARWIWRSLGVLAAMIVLGVFQYRAAQQTRDAQRDAQEQATLAQQVADARTTQAEVEQGRQALLQGDSTEAWLHLTEAYRRGERSPDLMFMLARALQARLAEQARFASSSGRMWSAAFSPDGKRIVTTDDKSAQVWDAQTSRLLFTLPHGGTVYHAVYSADGTWVVTASGDGTVKIWNAVNGSLLRELTYDGKPTRYYLVAISPDGKLAAAIDTMGMVAHVWDARTGARVAEPKVQACLHTSSSKPTRA
jgi:hypothetical protein